MSASQTLALGVDLGSARTRVALLERSADGTPIVAAVASRATSGDPARALADAWHELETVERRCVLAVDRADALLHVASFPTMRGAERERAARFEAARTIDYPLGEADVRLAAAGEERYVLGIVRKRAREAKEAAAKRAGLRAIAVDDAAFGLLRAFPDAAAVVDFGAGATTIIIPEHPVPAIRRIPIGGRDLTAAVASALDLADADAEERKQRVGLAGAGEHARDGLLAALAAAFVEIRAGGVELRSVVATGNAARLAGFAEALARAIGIPVELARFAPDAVPALPPDVVRAASPDWALAVGLALWEDAA